MHWRAHLGRRVFVIAIAGIVWPAPARSQAATATLSGTVVDETEAAVPNATLALVNDATALTRTTQTGATVRSCSRPCLQAATCYAPSETASPRSRCRTSF